MSTQQTTIESNSHFVWPNGRTVPLSAAALWAVVAVAWSVARVLERTRAWEGSPSSAFMVGYVALIGAGILTLIHVLAATGGSTRSTKTKAGIAVIGVGLAVSVAIGWALPIWAAVYGVGMLLVSAGGRLPVVGWLMGGSFVGATAMLFVLTALKVGTPDSYGDYPVAWTTATLVATLGASLAMLIASRIRRQEQ